MAPELTPEEIVAKRAMTPRDRTVPTSDIYPLSVEEQKKAMSTLTTGAVVLAEFALVNQRDKTGKIVTIICTVKSLNATRDAGVLEYQTMGETHGYGVPQEFTHESTLTLVGLGQPEKEAAGARTRMGTMRPNVYAFQAITNTLTGSEDSLRLVDDACYRDLGLSTFEMTGSGSREADLACAQRLALFIQMVHEVKLQGDKSNVTMVQMGQRLLDDWLVARLKYAQKDVTKLQDDMKKNPIGDRQNVYRECMKVAFKKSS